MRIAHSRGHVLTVLVTLCAVIHYPDKHGSFEVQFDSYTVPEGIWLIMVGKA